MTHKDFIKSDLFQNYTTKKIKRGLEMIITHPLHIAEEYCDFMDPSLFEDIESFISLRDFYELSKLYIVVYEICRQWDILRKNLPVEYAERAIHNSINYNAKYDFSGGTLSEALKNFSWFASPESNDFWDKVYKYAIAELPEIK